MGCAALYCGVLLAAGRPALADNPQQSPLMPRPAAILPDPSSAHLYPAPSVGAPVPSYVSKAVPVADAPKEGLVLPARRAVAVPETLQNPAQGQGLVPEPVNKQVSPVMSMPEATQLKMPQVPADPKPAAAVMPSPLAVPRAPLPVAAAPVLADAPNYTPGVPSAAPGYVSRAVPSAPFVPKDAAVPVLPLQEDDLSSPSGDMPALPVAAVSSAQIAPPPVLGAVAPARAPVSAGQTSSWDAMPVPVSPLTGADSAQGSSPSISRRSAGSVSKNTFYDAPAEGHITWKPAVSAPTEVPMPEQTVAKPAPSLYETYDYYIPVRRK